MPVDWDGQKPGLDRIWKWNQQVPPTIETCVHDLISQQARAQPDTIAIQSWDGNFTYSELESLSTRLAYHLITSRGVTIGTRIPLCFEKSKWAVLAVLAVMKAGATFSLTDPSQPEARLRTIVEQTEANIVITSSAQRDLGQRIAGDGQVLAVSEEYLDTLQSTTPPTPLPNVPPSTPMYIIFTSGSTGKPKGVVISHENYTSGVIPRAEAVGYKSTSRCFDFPSYAFDVSIDCMLCTLFMGGRVCVPSEEARMNDLSGAIRNSGANMVHMTPSVARVLDPDIIPSLEVLGLGGEAVSASDAATWSQSTNLVIAYGPSECTVGCTINNTVTVSTGIGKGVGGVTWIVNPDNHNDLAAEGEVGELIIEGPVVGVGYLGEPDKTAEVFIDDPTWLLLGHGQVQGRHGRLYKTGDLVRYESNGSGSIEFVGRKDQQVKLRGQRVELAEVEHHLQASLPTGVKVVAEVIKPKHGVPTLMAFLSESHIGSASNLLQEDGNDGTIVEPSPELIAALSELNSTMGSKVPRYMIPAAFVALREIPSLVSRKTDRKQLRKLGVSIPRERLIQPESGDPIETEEPTSTVEKQMQQAWRQVLGDGTPIYRESNFFQLGGDSLRAMKLLAAARANGLVLTVADVFTNPTLVKMAAQATTASEDASLGVEPLSLLPADWRREDVRKDVSQLCGIGEAEVEDVYPCTPLQEALMALSAKVKDAYVAQRVVRLDSKESGDRLTEAFQKAHKDCPILRTRIAQVPAHGLVQIVTNTPLEWHAGTCLEKYLPADRGDPMDLGKPLVRYALIDDATTGVVSFVLTMHHALYDGWSMPLVVDRVNKAHQGEGLTRSADFRHFIQYLVNKDKTESATYWKNNLSGADGPQFPSLPWPGYQTQADSLLELYVPIEQQPAANVTMATVIRAAWALVASQYINTDDVIFGETLTGRNAPIPGAEEIEGPMITTVPVRIQIDRESTTSDYLRTIQEQIVEQIPHEHFGLQHIRRLSPDALEACELRTGLVMHPSTDLEETRIDGLPADNLVPAGDAEAAQEALKFNTYALMLVCSIDPRGFLIMASFDSKTVDKAVMEKVLEQFKQTTQKLCQATDLLIKNVSIMTESDIEQVEALAQQAVTQDVLEAYPSASAVYVVSTQDSGQIVPVGGIGEVCLSSEEPLDLPVTTIQLGSEKTVYKTGRLGKVSLQGSLEFMKDGGTKRDALANKTSGPTKRITATSRKQKKLRSLWSRVLRCPEEDISLNDDFFYLGGDSITAMKLVSEARNDSITLTVMQIFKQRTLYNMASAMKEEEVVQQRDLEEVKPLSLIDTCNNSDDFLENVVRPRLANPESAIADVIPARPLQEVAVKGTTQMPRFSVRYEMMHFDHPVDSNKIRKACHDLVARNEILRTVFIKVKESTFGVVLENLVADFVEYEVDSNVEDFARKLCQLDVLTKMLLGSAFVKWFFIQGDDGLSSLVFRISHAQYDEISLPILLRQFSSLYEDLETQPTVPFSSYVGHVLRRGIPESIAYWKSLLQGSTVTELKPNIPLERRNHFAIEMPVDISARPRTTTAATLPTAAWALCLARRLSLRDVTFGEVVSGRNIDFPNADAVVGPCWQYSPVRVRFEDNWTAADLLSHVQDQHVASAAHECMGIREIAETCADWPAGVDWFDTVVHQDVEHVEDLGLSVTGTRMETLYVQEEPLREWKIQAFFRGETMTLEIVTFESWADYARELLTDLCAAARFLVEEPESRLFVSE